MMSFDEYMQFINLDYVKSIDVPAVGLSVVWAHRRRMIKVCLGLMQGAGFESSPPIRLMTLSVWTSQATIGWFGGGKAHEEMNRRLLDFAQPLPENKPRYLMGVGAPDGFDRWGYSWRWICWLCLANSNLVMGLGMTSQGRLVVKMLQFAEDFTPLDAVIITHVRTTRAYLRHRSRLMKPLVFAWRATTIFTSCLTWWSKCDKHNHGWQSLEFREYFVEKY